MIKIKFTPKTFTLDITGHAGHGKKGEDIVCAAVSSLFYTLGEALLSSDAMLQEPMVFCDDDGKGHLSCKPKKEYEANISLIYWTILKGFEMIEKNYKKNVKLSVVR